MNDCHQSQLNLFTKTPSDTSLKSKEWIEYKPTNQINDTSAINFSITAQSSAYVDLKSSVLNVKLRLTNGDGTPMNETIVAGLVNTPLHSIFRQVDVTFQQRPYHTRAIIIRTKLTSIPSLKPTRMYKKGN